MFLISTQRKQPKQKAKTDTQRRLSYVCVSGYFDFQITWIDLTHNVYVMWGWVDAFHREMREVWIKD